MKKLLLLSLLTLSATSFANVFQGTDDYVRVPLKVTGQVIDTEDTKLVVETDSTTGVDGSALLFDFGSIIKPATGQVVSSRSANFSVRKGNNTAFDFGTSDMKIGIATTNALESSKYAVKDKDTSNGFDVLGGSGKIDYTVTSSAGAFNGSSDSENIKKVDGKITVAVTIDGSGAKVGQLLDASKDLLVYLTTAE